jgi:CRP/FNR family transcriptional regulator, cyclic AMP receptor protein
MASPIDPGFLRHSDLFENQSEEVLQAVLAQGQLLEFGPGDVIFRQGDQGDRLFIVKSGVLEVLSTPTDSTEQVPVAYLGTGEVLGELALLTGSPRTATVRSPERAELFTIQKPVFLDLMDTLPAFSRNLCLVLAKRLETTTLKVPRASGKQLQGNLKFFDLATVIQTLIGSHQTGSLVVSQEGSKQKIAEIFFFKGNIARAKYRHLAGDDAVFQLFQSPLEGEFSFTGRNVAEEEVQTDITMPAISLLMESVRLQDELPMYEARISDPERVFRQKAGQLEWPEAETVELAAAVWSRLKKGASINDLQRDIPRCSFSIYRTMVTLLDAGQVE